MVCRLDIPQVEMTYPTSIRGSITRLRIKMTEMACFLAREECFFRNLDHFLLFFFFGNLYPRSMTDKAAKTLFCEYFFMHLVRKGILHSLWSFRIPSPFSLSIPCMTSIQDSKNKSNKRNDAFGNLPFRNSSSLLYLFLYLCQNSDWCLSQPPPLMPGF